MNFLRSALASALLFAAFSVHASRLSDNWRITVYYTAVESFHKGRPVTIHGCFDVECEKRGIIGTFPSDFVKAVREEGTGRITSGKFAGQYLCWSSGTHYWIDPVPKSSEGVALVPWVTAAADGKVMSQNTPFKVIDCGLDDSENEAIDPEVCSKIKNAEWKISDRFEPGLGGERHIDLYIGEEDQNDFVNLSPKVISVKGAQVSLKD